LKIEKPEGWMVDALSEAVRLPPEVTMDGIHKGNIAFFRYRSLVYAAFLHDFARLRRGTTVFFHEKGSARIIPAYPPLREAVLLSKAVPRHFVDKVVVEEKLNGYNVQVLHLDGSIVALTRDGLVCPYTTGRLQRDQGERLKELLESLDPGTCHLVGEVIGLENPYARYFYPEEPRFGYYVFDIYCSGSYLSPTERSQVLLQHNVKEVPVLATVDKHDVDEIRRIVSMLERSGRGGIVLRDPKARVAPLKYTTEASNLTAVRSQMRLLLGAGQGSQLLISLFKEVLRIYEIDLRPGELRDYATRLGWTIVEPALETLRKIFSGLSLQDEFDLEFSSINELKEFTEYMKGLGINLEVVRTWQRGSRIVARLVKHIDVESILRKVVETGVLPPE
jgi:putative ATP-dependent DNA ligase